MDAFNSIDLLIPYSRRKQQNNDDQKQDNECNGRECKYIDRICIALKRYRTFIQNQTKANDEKIDNEELSKYYDNIDLLNSFHHLLRVHSVQFEEVYNKLIDKCSDGKICALSDCYIIRRNHRDRSKLIDNVGDLRKLYFNYDDDNTDIVTQQILDKIHSHYFHSFDIGYKLSQKERLKIYHIISNHHESKEKADDDGFAAIHDKIMFEICKFIGSKKKSYQNEEGLKRLSGPLYKFSSDIKKDKTVGYSFGYRFLY